MELIAGRKLRRPPSHIDERQYRRDGNHHSIEGFGWSQSTRREEGALAECAKMWNHMFPFCNCRRPTGEEKLGKNDENSEVEDGRRKLWWSFVPGWMYGRHSTPYGRYMIITVTEACASHPEMFRVQFECGSFHSRIRSHRQCETHPMHPFRDFPGQKSETACATYHTDSTPFRNGG